MLNYADFSATTRRRERAESDSQPESDGVPEYRDEKISLYVVG